MSNPSNTVTVNFFASETWYAIERGKRRLVSLPFCVWINRPQDCPLEGGYERKSITRTAWSAACWTKNEGQSYPHFMTCNRLDKEGNAGHSIIVTGWNGGKRKKPNDWPIVQTPSFSLVEVWKRNFSSGQTLARDRRQFSQAPGKVTCKKIRTESLDRSQQEEPTFSQILEMPLTRKRKEPEN